MTAVERCNSCVFWGMDYPKSCGFVGLDHEKNSATRFDIQVYTDGDTFLERNLLTGPDFGCVHHKKKD